MDGWMDGREDGWMEGCMCMYAYIWMDGCMYVCVTMYHVS